jgi:hypothetical protein
MSERPKVFVFCSHTQGFHKMLEFLRAAHPEAYLAAIFPQGHLVAEKEQELLDEVVIAPTASYSLFKVNALLGLARQLRARELDELILAFESLKLRLFVVLVKPRTATAWLTSGQRLALSTHLVPTLWDLFVHRLRGYGTLVRVNLLTLLRPIKAEIPDKPDH